MNTSNMMIIARRCISQYPNYIITIANEKQRLQAYYQRAVVKKKTKKHNNSLTAVDQLLVVTTTLEC